MRRTQSRAMRPIFRTAALALVLLASAPAAQAASIVTEWLDDAIPIANDVAWEPTIGARFFAIFHTAMYDAWTAYDPRAVAVASGTALKNEGGPASEADKREAISYAAYTVLSTLAPQRRRELDAQMAALGYDPSAVRAPAQVGRRAALAVLAHFRDDGSNEAGGFADTTGFKPTKPGVADAWRPNQALGEPQIPTTPQWGRVMPFALTRADQFRPPPPPAPGSDEWTRQRDLLIATSGSLTDAQKAAVEFWNEWGSSPAPHLIELTKFVSDANDLRTDDDVKLFFIVSNALLDASIATWEEKYFYDYVRPITVIRALGDARIVAWRPRSLTAVLAYTTPLAAAAAKDSVVSPAGIGEMRAADWRPYIPTPSFPSYVSGHSAFSAAWARAMELATGTTELNFRISVKHLYVEQRELAQPVVLDYPTFEAAAEACGVSRIWGGIHWPVDNERGRELGRKVGENAWNRAQQYLTGAASPAGAAMTTLRSPSWFHASADADYQARFSDEAGLAIDLSPGAGGVWRSVALDPMPAGNYELRLKVGASGGAPVRLKVAVEPRDGSQATPLGASESMVSPTGVTAVVTLPWTSDGARSFSVSVEAGAGAGAESTRVLVSAMDIVRVWPVVAGSPRYIEPSLAGRAQE